MDANIGRRQFLRTTAGLAGLSVGGAWGVARGQQGTLHHAARAQRVIFLFMHGGPSHVDTFDYKRALQANDGKPLPFERPKNIDAKPVLMKSPWKCRPTSRRTLHRPLRV
jgi:hypothetical protein